MFAAINASKVSVSSFVVNSGNFICSSLVASVTADVVAGGLLKLWSLQGYGVNVLLKNDLEAVGVLIFVFAVKAGYHIYQQTIFILTCI